MKIQTRHVVTVMMLGATTAAVAAGVSAVRTAPPAETAPPSTIAVPATPAVHPQFFAQAQSPAPAQVPMPPPPPAPAAAAQTGGAKPQMVEDVFKNVRVLRGITVDDFMGTMGAMSAALSMCCDSCHDGAGTDKVDWASDSLPRKVTARRMVLMTQAINKNNFGGRQMVTCWTCHRGRDFPTVTPDIEHDVYGEPRLEPDDVFRRVVLRRAGADGDLQQVHRRHRRPEAAGDHHQYHRRRHGAGLRRLGGVACELLRAGAGQARDHRELPEDRSNRGDETRTFDGTTGGSRSRTRSSSSMQLGRRARRRAVRRAARVPAADPKG